VDTTKSNWRLWLRNKLLILDRTRLTTALVLEQFLDLFTTWWIIFYMKVGHEANPLLQIINGENGLAWLVGIKLFAAALVGTTCWLSLAPNVATRRFWWMWNGLAYAYAVLVMWNTSLVVFATVT